MERYDAFISYSHAGDGQLAPRLQSGLQRFARPWWKPRVLRVFRDETGLSASPHLWSSIVEALDAADWFILLASPQAASSEWVAREITHWASHGDPNRILIAVTDGTFVWDEASREIDWERSTAAPRSLAGLFESEPRYIDLTWARADVNIDQRDGRFQDALAELASPLRGIPKDDLAGEDVRQHRKTVRIARFAGTALVLLTTVALIASFLAVGQRNEARKQRTTAEHRARVALSRELAARATTLATTKLDVALLLAAEANALAPLPATTKSLLDLLGARGPLDAFAPFPTDLGRLHVATISPEGVVYLAEEDGTGWIRETDRWRPLDVDAADGLAGVGLLGNTWLAVAAYSGREQDATIEVLRVADGSRVATIDYEDLYLGGARFATSGDGETLAALSGSGSTGRLHLWSIPSGLERRPAVDVRADAQLGDGFFSHVLLDDGGDRAVVLYRGAQGDDVLVVDVETGAVTPLRTTFDSEHAFHDATVAISGDGSKIALGRETGDTRDTRLEILDTRTGTTIHEITVDSTLTALGFRQTGEIVAGTKSGEIMTWSPTSRGPYAPVRTFPAHSGPVVGVLAHGDTVHSLTLAELAVWQLDATAVGQQRTLGSELELTAYDVSAGRLLGVVSGSAQWLDVATGRAGPTVRLNLQCPCTAATLSPDGSLLAVGTGENPGEPGVGVVLFDANSGAELARTADFAHTLEFSPDGRVLAIGHFGAPVTLLSVPSLERVDHAAHASPPSGGVAFSPDGEILVTGDRDGAIHFWDTRTGERTREPIDADGEVASPEVSPNGRYLATLDSQGRVGILDLSDPEAQLTDLESDVDDFVPMLAFSADSSALYMGRWATHTLTTWDVASAQPTGTIVHDSPIIGLYARPGHRLLTATVAGTVTEWNLEPSNLASAACRIAGRNLSAVEWAEYVGGSYRKTCDMWPSGT